MTPEQAIRILDEETTFETVIEIEYYAGFNTDKVVEQIQKAMNMGAAAIKKQVGVKVLYSNLHGDGPDLWNKDRYSCPVCGRRLRNKQRDPYCGNCGQKLVWEE